MHVKNEKIKYHYYNYTITFILYKRNKRALCSKYIKYHAYLNTVSSFVGYHAFRYAWYKISQTQPQTEMETEAKSITVRRHEDENKLHKKFYNVLPLRLSYCLKVDNAHFK